MKEKLFLFHDALRRTAFRVTTRPVPEDEEQLLRGIYPAKTLEWRQYMGQRLFDLVGTGYGSLFILSDRVIRALKDTGATGWRAYPAAMTNLRGTAVHGYAGLRVTGRCGPAMQAFTERGYREPPCSPGYRYEATYNLYFDPATWDGSDLFKPSNWSHTIVTERVRDALVDGRFTNIKLIELAEIEIPDQP